MAKQIKTIVIEVTKEGERVSQITIRYTLNDSVNTDLTKRSEFSMEVTPEILATTFSDGLALLDTQIKALEGIS